MDNEKLQPVQEQAETPVVTMDTTAATIEEEKTPAEAAPAAENKAPYEKKPYRQNNMRGRRRKVCAFCADKTDFIDYKDAAKLRKFISERGKILPRRLSGTRPTHQRELTSAMKRARDSARLPYVTD